MSVRDDILLTRFIGDYTLEIAKELQEMTNALAKQHGYRLLLLDVQQLGSVTPEARAFLVEDQRREQVPSAVGIFGANFAIRTLASMIIRAVSALTKVPVALSFFDNEEDARTWLLQQRNRLRAAIASSALP